MITRARLQKAVLARLSRYQLILQGLIGPCRKYCNCCNRQVAGFFRYGSRPFGCPGCGSSTRERFVKYCLSTNLLSVPGVEGGVLHVAPSEKSLIEVFRLHGSYTPVDLTPELYQVTGIKKMDLMALCEIQKYGLVYLSHIMEHVPDDKEVLRRLFESIVPGGQGWFLVPMWSSPTIDGTSEMSPVQREQQFGQWDHQRQYGPDFADRIRDAGFEVSVIKPEIVPEDEADRLGLSLNDWIFVGRKP